MTEWRRLRAGIRITLIVSIAWTLLVLGYKTIIELLGFFSVDELVAWFGKRILWIWCSGLFLGLLISAGVALPRRNRQPRPLSVARATALGSLGGLIVSIPQIRFYKGLLFSNLLENVLFDAGPLIVFGALIGYGIGRVAVPRDKPKVPFRETILRWSRRLSVVFLADGLFMAWALHDGGYAMLGYGQISFFPVFMPALLMSLVMLGIYAHGAWRRSWYVRRSEWGFFLVFALAVAAKVVVIARHHRG
jgi:hypothetical protein